jgi:hypothetical protein
MPLLIQLTRVSPTHHRSAYRREDGSGGAHELESKSFLTHDLLHFCAETEAALTDGFYGCGKRAAITATWRGAAGQQSHLGRGAPRGSAAPLARGNVEPEAIIAGLENLYQALERAPARLARRRIRGARGQTLPRAHG